MADNRMELFIETLTGTAFELSCSPFETIVSIKAKIQYSEGIPVSQQHLIWKSQELNDDFCLQDYEIQDGATLKLVLGMRGGPINTRQISDTKKLKELSDLVEKRNETSSSGGRPFTVLVFHDGDKVHMYTVMEKGECTVSPVSGTISDTSSVASLKNAEELDQELIRENEITKEKVTQLQEQIKALNINRSKRLQASMSQVKKKVTPQKPVDETTYEKFHLPSLQKNASLVSQSSQYLKNGDQQNVKDIEKHYFSRFAPVVEQLSDINDDKKDGRASSISFVDKSPKASSRKGSIEPTSFSCSNFLPYIESVPGATSPIKSQKTSNAQCLSLSSSCLNPIIKQGFKNAQKQCPLTSSQALSTKRFQDLDRWLQNRPKTTPEVSLSKKIFEEESLCQSTLTRENRVRHKLKKSFKSPLSVSLSSGEKASLLMETYSNSHRDLPYEIASLPSKNKANFVHTHSNADVGTFLTAGLRALKVCSPSNTEAQGILTKKISKSPAKSPSDISRPSSGRKLPLIKAKKKSYKRCSFCSRRTGLATSYTCRCGKNFCAPHRYAEVHQCSYDYKTEGRRLLQLNNPVVAASKLPKI